VRGQRRLRIRRACAAWGTIVLIGAIMAGCSNRGPAPVNTGLESLESGRGVAPLDDEPASIPDPAVADEGDAWAQAAIDLQRALDETAGRSEQEPSEGDDRANGSEGAPLGAQARREVESESSSTPVEGGGGAEVAERGEGDVASTDASGSERPGDSRDSDEREADRAAGAASRLASTLRLEMSEAGSPLVPAIKLGLLGAIFSEVAGSELAFESELGQRGLFAHEPRVVLAVRDLGAGLVEAGASPRPVGEMLDALDRASGALLDASPQFRVRAAALCTRVFGLASYDEFDRNVFLAGEPHRVIVYTEVERFGHRQLDGSEAGSGSGDGVRPRSVADRWAIEMSQALTLYHEPSGDLQAWHRPRSRVVETTRRKRGAMHLVNEILLPARLTVGTYTLKVSTRDETTGASDEVAIPIRIVADPSLASGGAGR